MNDKSTSLLLENLLNRSQLPQSDPSYIGWQEKHKMVDSFPGFEKRVNYWVSDSVGKSENVKSFQLNHSFRKGYELLVSDEKGDFASHPLFKIVGNEFKHDEIFNKNYWYLRKLNKVLSSLEKIKKEGEHNKTNEVAKKGLDETVRVVVSKNIEL